jgi:hypothetical protein
VIVVSKQQNNGFENPPRTMMRTTSTTLKSLAVVAALLSVSATGFAAIVYDNSTGDLNRTYIPSPNPNGVEFGDEINLAGVDRIVNNFKFEYFLSAAASGNETAQLVIFANDGAPITRTNPDGTTFQVPSPSTVLYTSPVLSLATGFQTAEASGFEFLSPDTFTWAVTFQGVEAGEIAGLRIYDPPTVGTSFADFWERSNGTWNTFLINDAVSGAIPANFAARVSAVPEPTTVAMALLAGLGWIGYLGYKRRS